MDTEIKKSLMVQKGKESRVSCRVKADLLAKLERIAERNGISVSDVVRMALLKVLPLYEQEGK